ALRRIYNHVAEPRPNYAAAERTAGVNSAFIFLFCDSPIQPLLPAQLAGHVLFWVATGTVLCTVGAAYFAANASGLASVCVPHAVRNCSQLFICFWVVGVD